MVNRISIPCFLFLLISGYSLAQNTSVPPIIRAQNTLSDLSRSDVSSSYIMYGIPMEPGKLVGDFYLDNKWNKASFLLYGSDKLSEGHLTRYDIYHTLFEIRVKEGIKILEAKRVRSAVWIDSLTQEARYFVNAKDYQLDGIPLDGVLEVLVDGESPLFKHHSTSIKKADYNVALDMGSKDDKVIKKVRYFFGDSANLIAVTGKKKLLDHFSTNGDSIDSYIKSEKLTISREGDLVKVFTFINGQHSTD